MLQKPQPGEQLGIDRIAGGGLRQQPRVRAAAWHRVHTDVFGGIATTGADSGQVMGAHEADDLVAHAGRGRTGVQKLDVRGAPAGFFLQFARGGQ